MKKQIARTVGCVLLALLILLSPALVVAGVVFLVPPQYGDTFLGELDEKYRRLTEAEGEKLVIVGGSSVAFGYDSSLLEAYTGREVVNFGLYAALGTKLMMDLSRAGIKRGDIVILAPELDPETLSLYFNAESTWQAAEGDFSMLRILPMNNKMSLLGAAFSYAEEKLGYFLAGNAPKPEGVYSASSFNKYGDINYPREHNVMTSYYDKNKRITLSPDIFSADFIDYVNEYIHYCEKKGATVYFTYSPMNASALTEETTEETILAMEEYLEDSLTCPILGRAEDAIFEAGYFYDTNFHLNDAGVVAHTAGVVRDVLLELGIPTYVDIEIPPAPELPHKNTELVLYDENEEYFTFRAEEDGSYTVTGLSALGKTMRELTLPRAYRDRRVTEIADGALSGGILTSLRVPALGTSEVQFRFANGAFRGADTLSDLWLFESDATAVLPPSDFVGVAEGFRVHIPADSFYASDYNWSQLGLTFVYDAES